MTPSMVGLIKIGFWICLLGLIHVHALTHTVNNFRDDFSGNANDTLKINSNFGDTLYPSIILREYRTVGYETLSDGKIINGLSGSQSMAAVKGNGFFEFAYVSWPVAHSTFSGSVPVGDIRQRQAYVTDDSAGFAANSRLIAEAEMPLSSGNRAPSHLWYEAEGSAYVAYWSNLDNGKLRRTSDIVSSGGGAPSIWGSDVTPGTPVTLQAYGAMGGSAVAGSQMRKTVLAYVSQITGASSTLDIRWEDLQANTSDRVTFTRSTAPEDFSIAADSAGRTVMLWREASVMYMAAYNADHTLLQAPTAISGISINDGSANFHFYRPFQVISLERNIFQIVYGRSNMVYSRCITLNVNNANISTTELTVSKAGQVCFFPSISKSSSQVVMAWFQRIGSIPSPIHKLKSSVYSIKNGSVDTTTKMDFDVASDSVGYVEVPSAWTPYHYFQTASVAIDDIGNFAVGYSDGFHAKAALVKYAAIYPETSLFISKALQVANASATYAYDPTKDSVEYFPFELSSTNGIQAKLAVSTSSVFSAPSDSFRTITTSLKTSGSYYRYRLRLNTLDTAHLFPARLLALDLPMNVKPRAPEIDSIRFSMNPWRIYSPTDTTALVRRLDSVEFRISSLDLDDADSLQFHITLAGKPIVAAKSGIKSGVGRYLWFPKFPAPDTNADFVTFKIQATDAKGWVSKLSDIVVRLTDPLPISTLKAFRHRGLDSNGTFYGNRGPVDTISLEAGDTLWAHSGDTMRVAIHVTDLNDSILILALGKSGQTAADQTVVRNTTMVLPISLPNAPRIIESWTLKTADPDTSLFFAFKVQTNFPPVLDSMELTSYTLRNGSRATRGGMVTDFSANPELAMPAQVPAILKVKGHDPDAVQETVKYHWESWRRPVGCAIRDANCIKVIDSSATDSLGVMVKSGDDQVQIRVTDSRNAFKEYLVQLTYSLADTTSVSTYQNSLLSLDTALDFIMLSGVAEKTVNAILQSNGTLPLEILSAKTTKNQADHLELTLVWQDSSKSNSSQGFNKGTQQNPIENPGQVVVPLSQNLTVKFRFFTSALKGDTVFTDTLVIQTNDLAAPIIRIPFRLVHRELPRLTLLGGQDLESNSKPSTTSIIGLKAGIRLAFSEPVAIPSSNFITVYSLLDSLAKPKSYASIPGTLLKRKSVTKSLALQGSMAYQLSMARMKQAAVTDSLVDTLIFIPNYSKASDSLKAKPKPGQFLPRDILRIKLTNGPTDPMGNALDLRRERIKRAASSYDTTFTVRTDTSVLRIVKSIPAQGDTEINPDASVRIFFNRPLASSELEGFKPIDLTHLSGSENDFFEWTSARTGDRPLDFGAITLLAGDTELVIKPRERATAYDTVSLKLSGAIIDLNGTSLDGNGDGFPGYQFNPQPGVDDWVLSYQTGAAGFYVFPNPFRFNNPRHISRGYVTFKNLNSLSGWKESQSYEVRIHEMTGELVWSHARHASESQRRGAAVVDWNLQNDQGMRVATGIYVYSVTDGSNRLMIKGKLAVIR